MHLELYVYFAGLVSGPERIEYIVSVPVLASID